MPRSATSPASSATPQFQQELAEYGTPQLAAFNQLMRPYSPEKRVELALGLAAKLQPWCEGVFGETFATTTSTFPGFDRLIDEGRICVISMPEDRFGRAVCRRTALCLLSAFMDAALKRTNPASGINRERIVHLMVDEAHAVMSQRLADFTDVNRQSKTAVWLAHQSIGQIAPEFRHQIVANTRTKVALALNDIESARACSEIFGTHKVKRETRSKGRSARGGGSVGVSTMLVEEALFSPDDLWHLSQWQGVVKAFDGSRSAKAVQVRLTPHFRARPIGLSTPRM